MQNFPLFPNFFKSRVAWAYTIGRDYFNSLSIQKSTIINDFYVKFSDTRRHKIIAPIW